jgi:hypothetical protein
VRDRMRVDDTTSVAARERLSLIAVETRAAAVAPALLFLPFMPRTPYDDDFEIDPGRNPRGDRDEHLREPDAADAADVEPDRSVARHAEEAEEAEEAEIAEEDILEIADLEDEMDARKGDGPDA